MWRWLKIQIEIEKKNAELNVIEFKLFYKVATYGFNNKHVTEENNRQEWISGETVLM